MILKIVLGIKLPKKQKKLIVTEPYKSAASGEVGLTYAAPFYDRNGNFRGVVGGDYDLANFFNQCFNCRKIRQYLY